MSSTATSAATSSEASLQQQQSKQQRKTLVSKILKRTTSLQPCTSHDQKQSTSVNSTVTLNLKNNEVADSEEIGKYSKMTYMNLLEVPIMFI